MQMKINRNTSADAGVALKHDNPERNAEMQAQQKEMRKCVHLVANL